MHVVVTMVTARPLPSTADQERRRSPGLVRGVNFRPTVLARVRHEHVGYLTDVTGFGGMEANNHFGSGPNALGDTRGKLIEHDAAESAAAVLDRHAVAVVRDGRDDVALVVLGRRFALFSGHARDCIRSVSRREPPLALRFERDQKGGLVPSDHPSGKRRMSGRTRCVPVSMPEQIGVSFCPRE